MVQLSHPYMTTGKTIALTRWTISKVMSLLFNMLSRLVIAFLPRSKLILISWLQPLSAVILKAKNIKCVTISNFSLFTCHEEMGIPDYLTCLLQNLHIGQEATVRTEHEQWTGSKLGKESIKAVYCYLAYLTSMQSTSCETLGWMKHKLESRFPGKYQ